MEAKLLKQRLAHNQISSLFNSMQVPLPTSLDTIEDRTSRQCLMYRYEQLLERESNQK